MMCITVRAGSRYADDDILLQWILGAERLFDVVVTRLPSLQHCRNMPVSTEGVCVVSACWLQVAFPKLHYGQVSRQTGWLC